MNQPTTAPVSPPLPLEVRDANPLGREAFTVDLDDEQRAVRLTITQEDGSETDFWLTAGEARMTGATLRRAARQLERTTTT